MALESDVVFLLRFDYDREIAGFRWQLRRLVLVVVIVLVIVKCHCV